MVVPFDQCIARPPEETIQYPLIDHLEAVAAGCGVADGTMEDRLAFLAGLLHDAAKAQSHWQDYIRGHCKKGPSHAPLGAALFAFCADSIINLCDENPVERQRLRDIALDWTRAIYNHHGELDNLDTIPPWERSTSVNNLRAALTCCDSKGLFMFIADHFPNMKADAKQFGEWLEQFAEKWERRYRFDRNSVLRKQLQLQTNSDNYSISAFRFPQVASRLIRADRYHVGKFHKSYLQSEEAEKAINHLVAVCRTKASESLNNGADPALVKLRQNIQKEAVTKYQLNADSTFFTLLLPTGYGKTLTSLRIALEACRSGRCKRVVYVAPYLSILSQAAQEMMNSSGLEVFQHHHLSLAEIADDEDVDVLDTWQAPLLATTFNQFFRSLFPSRAQECLRIDALQQAFIIIDEPQIIDASVWNIFLRGLAANSYHWQCNILFATATLPPLALGLGQNPIPLAPEQVRWGNRFALDVINEPLSADDVVDYVCHIGKSQRKIAVVLNSVSDAAYVYRLLQNRKKFKNVYCLTAMMLPSHKAAIIRNIREKLKINDSTVAVCTQILEAGVDLSFRSILRALPVLPSIAQTAGRVNRHGESNRATISVFPFVRENGVDVRKYVYRNETARRQTDALLNENRNLNEEDMGHVLDIYYRRCWEENRNEACLAKFEQAACGHWSELAGLEPFDSGANREDIFVPLENIELNPAMCQLLTKFAPEGAGQLLCKYQDRVFRKSTTFIERKRFMSLLQQFIVPIPRKIASHIADQINPWLWRLLNNEDYSSETGLAHLIDIESDSASLIV